MAVFSTHPVRKGNHRRNRSRNPGRILIPAGAIHSLSPSEERKKCDREKDRFRMLRLPLISVPINSTSHTIFITAVSAYVIGSECIKNSVPLLGAYNVSITEPS